MVKVARIALGSVVLFLFAFLLSLVPPGVVNKADASGLSAGTPVTIALNFEVIQFPDQGAFIDGQNRTLVPVRFFAQAFDSQGLSVQVDWDGENRKVTLVLRERAVPGQIAGEMPGLAGLDHPERKETRVELFVGEEEALVNGETRQLDTSVQVYNGRAMIPLRFVSEVFGAEVGYESQFRQVNIQSKGVERTNRLVHNPYQDIDWDSIQRHKSALHFHTDESDGDLTPEEAIELYHDRGFTIMSITDHDNMGRPGPTWPWPFVPEGVLPIMGNELSCQHHITSYFTDYYGHEGGNEHESLAAVEADGGLAAFAHPGRYNNPEGWRWYVPYYEKYDSLFGLEVYNMGDRFPRDRELWDRLLSYFMPHRPIYGMSNDDMHLKRTLGINWNTLLLDNLTAAEARKALEEGRFFFSVSLVGAAPDIERVVVSDGAVEVVPRFGQVKWVSDGKVIHEGQRLEYRSNSQVQRYARACVFTEHGRTYTQPFGFQAEIRQ